MDRQARKLQTQREDLGNYGDEAAQEPSDDEDKEVRGPFLKVYLHEQCFSCRVMPHNQIRTDPNCVSRVVARHGATLKSLFVQIHLLQNSVPVLAKLDLHKHGR
jgi:hypothetical protein